MEFPKTSIFLFVVLSMAVAVTYHRYQLLPNQGQIDLASQAGNLLENHQEPLFSFETEESCSGERSQLNRQLSQIPYEYRQLRARNSAEFDRACLTYILRSSLENGESCRPCVTEEYVNVIYNAFGDLMSCLQIPQKDFLPRLFFDGGFQISRLAMTSADREFENYQKMILADSAPACQALRSVIGKMEPFNDRCGSARGLGNPIRSVFYLAVSYQQQRQLAHQLMRKHHVQDLLEKAGLSAASYDEEQLYQIVMALGSVAGIEKAVIHLKKYAQRRLDLYKKGEASPLQKSDFDFSRVVSRDSGKVMTFPESLETQQELGEKNYMNSLWKKGEKLNQVFRGGTCVPESYLAL